MKCDYCGASLTLEDKVCPHCGQVNTHAQEHIKAMEHYKGEFENTKRGVYSATQKYTQVTVRAIIIAVLVVLIAVCFYIYDNAYSLYLDFLRNDAIRNVNRYSEKIDQYMEEEDYRRLALFCEEHGIYAYLDEYEQYTPVIRAAGDYVYVCDEIMKAVTAGEEESVAWRWKYIPGYLSDFYEACDWTKYEYYENADREENVKALEIMEQNLEWMLQTYGGFTEEETAGLKEMSEAKRTVMFEEKFGYEE